MSNSSSSILTYVVKVQTLSKKTRKLYIGFANDIVSKPIVAAFKIMEISTIFSKIGDSIVLFRLAFFYKFHNIFFILIVGFIN